MPRLAKQPLIKDQVRTELVDLLRAGTVQTGDRLPSETELAQQMNCTRQTLRQALGVLEADGLITRRKGSGTFVRALPDRTSTSMVGIMMCNQGHVYHELTHLIAGRLQADAWIPAILAQTQSADAIETFDMQPLLRLVQMGCRHLVLHSWACDVPALATYLKASADTFDQLIWLSEGSIVPSDLPGDVTGLNFASGFLLALNHLHALGHRRVALCAVRPKTPKANDHYAMHWREAVAQSGPWDSVEVIHVAREDHGAITELLASPNRPTAIVTSDDWRAVNVINVAKELGLSVPGDLSVVGSLNTPWASEMNLTSTTNEVEAQAEAIRELIGLRHSTTCRRTFLVRPQLVVRGSTAAPSA